MLRREALRALLDRVTTEPIIANLGSATFDLYAAEDRPANFYTSGAMGLVSSVGLGVALAALFGFGGLAGAAAGIAKVLFFVFLILLVVSFISRAIQGKSVT